MKAFKVIYQHGHFIDLDTKKRIIPVAGAEFIITANPEAFTTEDPKLNLKAPLNRQAKAEWALAKFGVGKHYKVLDAGQMLFFRIGNSKRVNGDESKEYIFVCTLLEDLYLYLLKDKAVTIPEDWRIADCQCRLNECILGGLRLPEKIIAESPNQLFNHTVSFLFPMQRSGAANAFSTFFCYEPGMKISFGLDYKPFYMSLEKIRMKFTNDFRNGVLSKY